ncbi:MAG: preprotein translocase subunit SecG, partial [Pseudomonadota bacterium]
MNTLFNLIVVVQVLSALAIIGLVLMQHGKGADMGAAFGSGASGSLFGATGSSNFMSKSTGIAAILFFSATLGLSFLQTHNTTGVSGGVMD